MLHDRPRPALAVTEVLPSESPRGTAGDVIDRSLGGEPNGPTSFPNAVIELKILVVRERFVVASDTTEVRQLEQCMMTVIDELR